MIKKFELGDIRRIINMIQKKRSEGIKYIRTEKSGYYSLLSDNGELNYTMLNETSKYILDSCDGTRTVGEILDLLCVKYKDVEKEQLGADLEATLFNLTRSRVIRWKGENDMNNTPFLAQGEEKLEKEYSISLAKESDIRISQKMFAKFFKETEAGEKKVKYFFGNDRREFYSFIAIRQFLYSYYKDFFLLKEDAQLMGVIVVQPSQETYLNSATIQMIDTPQDIFQQAINAVKKYYSEASFKKINCLRLYIPENETALESIVKESGFRLEGVMEKEYLENINLKMYVL